jgi:hypothetical protein
MPEDISALAHLRWQSEQRGEGDVDQATVERDFVDWWSHRGSRFRAVLAVDGGEVVGMGFSRGT